VRSFPPGHTAPQPTIASNAPLPDQVWTWEVRKTDADTLLFFNLRPEALALYEAVENWLLAAIPGAQKRVQKTQITFFDRHVFACVSFARVLRKAALPPEPWLTLTLGLPAPLDSPRAAVQTEPYPGRWTVHLVIHDPAELDDELLGWLELAYAFSRRK